MTDEATPAPEAGEGEVLAPQVEEQAEAPENTTGQDESQPAETEQVEEQKSKSAERRERRKAQMQKLIDSEADANRKAEEAQREAEKIREAAKSMPIPKQEDFENFEEFQAALSTYRVMGAMDEREAARLEEKAKEQHQEVEQAQKRRQEERAENWKDQIQEGRAKYSDFDAVTQRPDLPISLELAETIADSDYAADVAYYFGKNPEEARAWQALPKHQRDRAFGRIEALSTLAQPKTVTTAPDPISTVKASATASKDPETMTPEEFRAWREKGGS